MQSYNYNVLTQQAIIHIRPRWPTNAGNFTKERDCKGTLSEAPVTLQYSRASILS